MGAILKQLAYLSVALLVLYALLWAISMVIEPPSASSGMGLDSSAAPGTLYMTEPKYVFLNRRALRPEEPRVVFVGASNVAVGFRQREVQQLLPGVEVDNLSVGGSNMSQVAQVVDLVFAQESEAQQRRTTFVVGMWYGMFATNRVRWNTPDRRPGDTDIDIERYRYGFYRRGAHGAEPVLPERDLGIGVALIHPYLVLDKLSRRLTEAARARLFDRAAPRTDADRNATVLTESDKETALRYWHAQLQTDAALEPEQFEVLESMIGRILASGAKVVLVDLPIPRWHAERSPYFPDYLRRKQAVLESFRGRPGFSYLEMNDETDDLDFSDEVHPKPRVTGQWAEHIASVLQNPSEPASAVVSAAVAKAPGP